jgi:glycosyltransferase involved in cell wall biosynthesis
MRILMLASYFPRPTNPSMGTWALSQALALQRRGVDIRVVSFNSWVPRLFAFTKGSRRYAFCPPAHQWGTLQVLYPRWLSYSVGPTRSLQHRYPTLPSYIAWQSAKRHLISMVRDFRPQLLYAHHTATNGYLAWKIKQLFGLPYVITDHDFWEIVSCAAYPSRHRFYSQVVSDAAAVIGVSTRMERDLRCLFPSSITYTVHNGADPAPSQCESTPRPFELKHRTVLFSCGAFYERKGFPLLLQAFARIAQRFPDAILRIAGDGPERAQIEYQIRTLQLETRVQLLGEIPHAAVLQEMAWCDIFVLLGWDEPFGVVFAEALAAAKPIICSNDGGINDIVKAEHSAITVPPKDPVAAATALARLLEDPVLRCRIGTAGRRLFETTLSWDHNAARMYEIFCQVVTQNPLPSGLQTP